MHVTEEDLESYLHRQLLPNQISIVNEHLAECEGCRDRLQGTEAFLSQFVDLSKAQSRRENDHRERGQRYVVDEVASMTQLHPLVPGRSDIRVIDVSRDGLKLLVPAALEVGTVVQIRMRPIIVTGEVRHCTVVGESFRLGVRILDLFPRES